MKRLLDMFKNLPPEARSLMAMMGVGSLAGVVYFLKAQLGLSMMQICLLLLGVSLLTAFGGLIVSKLFNFRARKRARRMADELGKSAESGPASMDARAAIKANNEKFFNAIREMRKTLGVNVYDLPWYIVIGDSGCGKTKLINEGGLTFSAGKPEGYQLGTLNYNWWFTEDAIFIDMAGRLCNPQEDGDRREWTAFLDTVGKGRKGYPINGALVCVSAEHLLEDSPEKIEADANTMLERLRDLQTRLGVTFGTYLLVTKCDKILGFMQFFDRAERDITMKNQIFGWSKPGDFNQLYDPEQFGADFDAVYSRMNDLRMRRLNDETDEIDLGLAYTFPEEFREFRDPLQIYVRTLFPMIKNPRAIKNLVFRGVYFTSATQQGGLILKHLTTRMGADAANQFSPLESMYPQPRPHFVKDLLFKKVFPEQGLVFRNEQEVVRHRRLSRILLYSSFIGFAGLMGVLAWSCNAVGTLISAPEKHVDETRPKNPQEAPEIAAAVKTLYEDEQNLRNGKWWARILSLGIGADAPITHLRTIQRELFRRYVVAQALKDVEGALRKPPAGKLTDATRETYENALLAYLQWVSAADPADKQAPAEAASLKHSDNPLWKLLRAAPSADKPDNAPAYVSNSEQFIALWNDYRDSSTQKPEDSLPRLTAASGQWSPRNSVEVTRSAAAVLHEYYLPYARLDTANPDPVIRETARIRQEAEKVRATYDQILQSGGSRLTSSTEYDSYFNSLKGSVETFNTSLDQCVWTARDSNKKPVPLQDLQKRVDDHWKQWNDRIQALQAACGMSVRKENIETLRGILDREKDGLNVSLAKSAAQHNGPVTTRPSESTDPAARPPWVRELTDIFKYMLQRVTLPQTEEEQLELTAQARTVRDALKAVEAQLKEATTSRPAVRYLADWNTYLGNLIKPATAAAARLISLGTLDPAWRQPELEKFLASIADIARRGQLGAALSLMARQFGEAERNEWGLASLEAENYLGCRRSPFRISGCGQAAPPPEPIPAPEPAAEPASTGRRSSRRDREPTAVEPQQPRSAPQPATTLQIPNAATREFLYNTFADAGDLTAKLADLQPQGHIADPQIANTLTTSLDQLRTRYLDKYFSEWKSAHDGLQLTGLQAVIDASDWQRYREALASAKASVDMAAELRAICADLFEHVLYAEQEWTGSSWDSDRTRLTRTRTEKWGIDFRMEGFRPTQAAADKPWTDLAARIADGWQMFSTRLGKYESFIQEFSDPKLTRTADAIKEWGLVSDDNIKATVGQIQPFRTLSEISAKGLVLLDRDIQRVLLACQTRLLGQAASLPYSGDGGGSGGVDPDKFAQFVEEMGTARRYFEPVDVKLAGTDGRIAFYGHCQEWRHLLGESQRWTPLPVNISLDSEFAKAPQGFAWKLILPGAGSGTAAAPPTGPQNFYGEFHLLMGLDKPGGGIGTDVTFLLKPELQQDSREWRWPAAAGQQYHVALDGGGAIISNLPRIQHPLPHTGKFGLLEFLARYGQAVDAGRTWKVGIGWNVPALLQNAGNAAAAAQVAGVAQKFVGTALVFKLDRPLPAPFSPLR